MQKVHQELACMEHKWQKLCMLCIYMLVLGINGCSAH